MDIWKATVQFRNKEDRKEFLVISQMSQTKTLYEYTC